MITPPTLHRRSPQSTRSPAPTQSFQLRSEAQPTKQMSSRMLVDCQSWWLDPSTQTKMAPQVNFPVIDVGVQKQCAMFVPTLPPKIDSDKVISYPMLPIQDHGSKYTTQEFGCSGKGLPLDKQKVLAAPGNRDIGDRHACLIAPKNLYEPKTPQVHKESLKALIHPVLV